MSIIQTIAQASKNISIILVIINHLFAFRYLFIGNAIAVDMVYPECFRGCKYGSCSYYKEFYDPAYHKTPQPFSKKTILEKKLPRSIDRDNYNPTKAPLIGKKTENSHPQAYIDIPKHSTVLNLPPSDANNTVQFDANKNSHSQHLKHSIFIDDIDRDLQPLA